MADLPWALGAWKSRPEHKTHKLMNCRSIRLLRAFGKTMSEEESPPRGAAKDGHVSLGRLSRMAGGQRATRLRRGPHGNGIDSREPPNPPRRWGGILVLASIRLRATAH